MSDPTGKDDRSVDVELDALGVFWQAMAAKLRANMHKAHWGNASDTWLIARLGMELGELNDAIAGGTPEEIIAECADVANFAMMIADNARRNL